MLPRALPTVVARDAVPVKDSVLQWAARVQTLFNHPLLLSAGMHVQFAGDSNASVSAVCYVVLVAQVVLGNGLVVYCVYRYPVHKGLEATTTVADRRRAVVSIVAVPTVDVVVVCLLAHVPIAQACMSLAIHVQHAIWMLVARGQRHPGRFDPTLALPLACLKIVVVLLILLMVNLAQTTPAQVIAVFAVAIHGAALFALVVIGVGPAVAARIWSRSARPAIVESSDNAWTDPAWTAASTEIAAATGRMATLASGRTLQRRAEADTVPMATMATGDTIMQ